MASESSPPPGADGDARPTGVAALVIAWALTCVPLAWGVYMTLLGALKLFRS